MPKSLWRHGKKIGTAIIGGIVVLIGIILIPYPGPGWLIVFAGMAILSTEFERAARVLKWLRLKYLTWTNWVKRQSLYVRIIILSFTAIVIIATIWLLNTFGLIDSLFSLNQDWLHSPLVNT